MAPLNPNCNAVAPKAVESLGQEGQAVFPYRHWKRTTTAPVTLQNQAKGCSWLLLVNSRI